MGRIDATFLDQNVRVLGTNLDNLPVSFRRDLLVHEAHHHPLIDRLGGMYLLRLRDGAFGNVAGTTWRCLFAAGLMPWIVKYKVNGREDICYDAGIKMQNCRLEWLLHDETSITLKETTDSRGEDDGNPTQNDYAAAYESEGTDSSDSSKRDAPAPIFTAEGSIITDCIEC